MNIDAQLPICGKAEVCESIVGTVVNGVKFQLHCDLHLLSDNDNMFKFQVTDPLFLKLSCT